MKARFPLALPFAVLASLVAGCSSSSGPGETSDSGAPDTGNVHHDAGATDAGGKKDTGGTKPDASADVGSDVTTPPPSDAGPPGVTVPAGAKSIVPGIVDVITMTTDDYIVYFDANGGVSASDIAGNISVVAPGPVVDGGASPYVVGAAGDIIAILTDYTTKSVSGTVTPVSGTLSIWSHTLGALKPIATASTGIVNIAQDGSYVAYTDSANATGSVGNIGIVAGDGVTGKADLATSVALDQMSVTCFPFALFDGKVAVVTDCAVTDAAVGSPSITAYDGASAWAPTVLAPIAAASSLGVAPYAINIGTDSVSGNALIVTPTAGGVLSSIPVGGGTATVLTSMFGAPSGGVSNFYMSPDGTAAYFTNADGSYGKSAFATPGAVPTTTTLAPAGSVFGALVFSSDGKYDVDFGTATDATTMQPTSLNLRNLATGTAVPLITSGSNIASTFGTVNGFTADNSYVIFTSDLSAVGSGANAGTAGNLKVAPVATGVATTINPTTLVWNANPLTGTKIIYNANYIPNTQFMLPNGNATGDVYIADATSATLGTKLITACDAGNYFYVTKDKSHLFFTFTTLALPDGATTGVPVTGDGLYSIALP